MRSLLRRVGAALLVALLAVTAWALLSPWPSVLVLRQLWPEPSREQTEALEALAPRDVHVERDVVVDPDDPQGRIDVYRPSAAGATPLPVVVWVHGGGFITGTKEGLDTYLPHIAAAGFTVVAVEYTVAPQARYPTPVDQTQRALRYVVGHAADLGADPTQVVLAGDSAGAQIAAQTAMCDSQSGYAARAGLPRADLPAPLRGVVLYSGALDLHLTKSATGAAKWIVQTMMWAYTGSRDPTDDAHLEMASLPQHVTAAFPPSFISTGPGDPLLAHSKSMADHLRAAGAQVRTLWFPDAPSAIGHEYAMDLRTPQAKESMRALLAFLRSRLDTPVPLRAPADSW